MDWDNVDIRIMEDSDYDDLVALWSCFPGNTMTGADDTDEFRSFLEINQRYCFVAESEGELVGSVMAGNDRRRGYVYHLAVSRQLHNRGIGRMLMEACEDSLRMDGVEKVHLFIYNDNPAIRFYERVGWHRREDIAVMSKVLIGEKYKGTRR